MIEPREARLTASHDRVTGIAIGSRHIEADQVVLTAGGLGACPAAAARPDAAGRAAAWPDPASALPGEDTRHWPVILPPGSHYLLAFDESRIVVGATRETGAGFDYRVTAAGQMELLSQALDIAPGLAAATVIETRIGFRPAGPGIRPLLGRAAAIEGLLIGNGLGAAGLTIGPFAGRLLADAALGRATAIDLAPFDPLRRPAPAAHLVPALR